MFVVARGLTENETAPEHVTVPSVVVPVMEIVYPEPAGRFPTTNEMVLLLPTGTEPCCRTAPPATVIVQLTVLKTSPPGSVSFIPTWPVSPDVDAGGVGLDEQPVW